MARIATIGLQRVFSSGQIAWLEYEDLNGLKRARSRIEEVTGKSLLVAMPSENGLLIALPIGTTVDVEVTRDDAVYRLPAGIVDRRTDRLPSFALAPTGPIERRQRREFVRLRMVIKPEQAHRLADAPPPQPISAIVVDLSAGGLLLRSRTPLSVGQQLLLDLDLPEPGGRLASLVEVVRLRPIQSERGQSIEAGCRFVDLPNRDRDRIVKFIFYCQAKLARTGTGLL